MGRVNAVSLFRYASKSVSSLRSEKKLGWFFCVGSFVFRSGFFFSAFLSVALTALPKTSARPLVVPSEDSSHGGGLTAPLFVKGDRPNTHSRSEKKDHENYITKKHLRAREPIRTVDQ